MGVHAGAQQERGGERPAPEARADPHGRGSGEEGGVPRRAGRQEARAGPLSGPEEQRRPVALQDGEGRLQRAGPLQLRLQPPLALRPRPLGAVGLCRSFFFLLLLLLLGGPRPGVGVRRPTDQAQQLLQRSDDPVRPIVPAVVDLPRLPCCIPLQPPQPLPLLPPPTARPAPPSAVWWIRGCVRG